MKITIDDLRAICPRTARATLERFVDPLNATFEEFDISTPMRVAAFLAQAAHECMGFQAMREFASGQAYAGRQDLGNDTEGVDTGDGVRYKGRGIFQLTGEANYARAGTELFLDADWFRMNPTLAEQPEYACRIAGWYWQRNGLNELADQGEFVRITKRINGGTNGIEDRERYHAKALEVLA